MGNASIIIGIYGAIAVHPHVHGERVKFTPKFRLEFGSSPRTWGTLSVALPVNDPVRFIPTYMGNADIGRLNRPCGSVHPHVHGERAAYYCLSLRAFGSSPRTWGTLIWMALRNIQVRFIPTYMGNALRGRMLLRRGSVHPHVHGERRDEQMSELHTLGSSPRTWGTQLCISHVSYILRFIPTYMGNAVSGIHPPAAGAVHPHVHGERTDVSPQPHRFFGSSPRTWGTPVHVCPVDETGRFIPTYMGNASHSPVFRRRCSVHPHVHGERIEGGGSFRSRAGSSPRTWGTLIPFYSRKVESYFHLPGHRIRGAQ